MKTQELLRRLIELQSVTHDAIECSSHLKRLIDDIAEERDRTRKKDI